MKLSKLLLPLDFSEKSAAAAAYARALACRFQSELNIAHVFELSRIFMPMPEGGTSAEWYEDRKNHARRELHEFGADLFAGMPVESVLLEGGDTARAIVDLAHSRQIDLIVMPTHGYGVFRRFMLGSVTAKVLHDADCPVWTGVHLADSTVPGPIQFRKILCAIDFDSTGRSEAR